MYINMFDIILFCLYVEKKTFIYQFYFILSTVEKIPPTFSNIDNIGKTGLISCASFFYRIDTDCEHKDGCSELR